MNVSGTIYPGSDLGQELCWELGLRQSLSSRHLRSAEEGGEVVFPSAVMCAGAVEYAGESRI